MIVASSCYFERILIDPSKESIGKEIVLEEICGVSLGSIINCCYRICACVTEDNFVQIVQLCYRFDHTTTLPECFEVLRKILNNENYIELFQLVERHDLTEFSEFILGYIY